MSGGGLADEASTVDSPPMRRFDDGGERGWFIIKAIALVIVALVIGLLLDGFGLGIGGYLVLAALAVFVIAFYVVPWLPTRR